MTPPKTHMERMGFRDPEIGSPDHDSLVLAIQEHAPEWLADHIEAPPDRWEEMREIRLKIVRDSIAKREHEAQQQREYIARYKQRSPQPWETDEQIRQRLEELINDLGSQEMEIDLWRQELEAVPTAAPVATPAYSFELEHLITTYTGYSLGFVDLVATVTYPYYDADLKNRTTRRLAAFEAKLAIPSLGELLRQLRFYEKNFGGYDAEPDEKTQNRFRKVPFIVVSPDTRHRAAIIDQGFYFWECRRP